jgi:hypothetical protein
LYLHVFISAAEKSYVNITIYNKKE